MQHYADTVPRKPPMKNRVVRVSDAEWDAAMRRADADATLLSEQIREFIRRYGKAYRQPPTP